MNKLHVWSNFEHLSLCPWKDLVSQVSSNVKAEQATSWSSSFSPFLFLTELSKVKVVKGRKGRVSICLSERIPRVNMFSLISLGGRGCRADEEGSTWVARTRVESRTPSDAFAPRPARVNNTLARKPNRRHRRLRSRSRAGSRISVGRKFRTKQHSI